MFQTLALVAAGGRPRTQDLLPIHPPRVASPFSRRQALSDSALVGLMGVEVRAVARQCLPS